MLACSRGTYQNILLRKSGGGAYRGGALKGMNTVCAFKCINRLQRLVKLNKQYNYFQISENRHIGHIGCSH